MHTLGYMQGSRYVLTMRVNIVTMFISAKRPPPFPVCGQAKVSGVICQENIAWYTEVKNKFIFMPTYRLHSIAQKIR